jgi:protein-S-isoprenylcysteine O-methyltransferase Ste14
VWDFYARGKGTLAAWNPPRHLVVVGLYRRARNPMYISVLVWLAGLSWWTGSLLVAAYGVLLAFAFHLRVVLFEERVLERSFGADWRRYAENVPRWRPRLRPWR